MTIKLENTHVKPFTHRNDSSQPQRTSVLLHYDVSCIPILEIKTKEAYDKMNPGDHPSYSTFTSQVCSALENWFALSFRLGTFNEESYDSVCEAFSPFLEKRAPFSSIRTFIEQRPW